MSYEIYQVYKILFYEWIASIEYLEIWIIARLLFLFLSLVILSKFYRHLFRSAKLLLTWTFLYWYFRLNLFLFGSNKCVLEYFFRLIIYYTVFDNLVYTLIKFLQLTFKIKIDFFVLFLMSPRRQLILYQHFV